MCVCICEYIYIYIRCFRIVYVHDHVICKKRQFYFFLIYITFISFPCLIVLTRFSCTIVNRTGEHGFQMLSFPVLQFSLPDFGHPNRCVVVTLIAVWICISLMTNDLEHLFICLFSICLSYLIKCL